MNGTHIPPKVFGTLLAEAYQSGYDDGYTDRKTESDSA